MRIAFIIFFLLAIILMIVINVISELRNDKTIIQKDINNSRKITMRQSKKILEKNKQNLISLEESISILGANVGNPIFMRIFKQEEVLEVWMKHEGLFHLIQTYPICSYSGDLGPKLKEGDKQSPEGFYYIKKYQLNPNSRFHLAFNIGYPNTYDKAHGRTGSFIMVHGACASIGCYAMTDEKIEEIYGLVEKALDNGQSFVRIHIFPFKMEDEYMKQYSRHRWFSFWKNLKDGYDAFEKEKIPPNVEVVNKEYVFD